MVMFLFFLFLAAKWKPGNFQKRNNDSSCQFIHKPLFFFLIFSSFIFFFFFFFFFYLPLSNCLRNPILVHYITMIRNTINSSAKLAR